MQRGSAERKNLRVASSVHTARYGQHVRARTLRYELVSCGNVNQSTAHKLLSIPLATEKTRGYHCISKCRVEPLRHLWLWFYLVVPSSSTAALTTVDCITVAYPWYVCDAVAHAHTDIPRRFHERKMGELQPRTVFSCNDNLLIGGLRYVLVLHCAAVLMKPRPVFPVMTTLTAACAMFSFTVTALSLCSGIDEAPTPVLMKPRPVFSCNDKLLTGGLRYVLVHCHCTVDCAAVLMKPDPSSPVMTSY
ncbi:hypothetical protein J6590_063985 [Homalodisca vitripennis]|nr:hypothetical protein J6590_063985 [Homalodisca vitripennis]